MTGALFGAPFLRYKFILQKIYWVKKSTAWILALTWFVLVTILLCIPGTSLPKIKWESKIFLDKWIHVFLFFVLVLLWCSIYKNEDRQKVRRFFTAITVLSIVYGIVMEIVQHYFIPFRSFDIVDMIADSAGAVAGYFIAIKKLLK